MIEILNESFRSLYNPTSEVSIDEGMIPFKGRIGFKQYMPAKPTKWGFRGWNLCDSNFFLYAFDFYAGKSSEGHAQRGLPFTVVTQLTSTFPNGYPYRLAINNFYTSVPLAEHLLSSYIYVVGTVRTNRAEFPTEVAKAKLKTRGDMIWRSKNSQILAMKWLDTKEVTLFSTMHEATKVKHVRRRSIGSEDREVDIPHAVLDYRRMMQGVDRHDQFTELYSFDHKSMKWWHPLFFDMLSRCVVHAWVWVVTYRTNSANSLRWETCNVRH